MDDWKKRVEQERVELSQRIEKLRDFKATDEWQRISEEQRNLMRQQLDAMVIYHNILWKRTLIK